MLHVVTYATHANGTFKKLINNKYNQKIIVLGWGQKWSGFSDKFKGVRKYIDKLPDEDVVIFLDGWDTIVNKDTSNVLDIFNSMKCDMLLSKDFNTTQFVFGTCKNGITANSGMYMGKVKSLKHMFDKVLCFKCKDDQVNLNKACPMIENLKIDENEIIFQNTGPFNKNPKGIFVSLPGTSENRKLRAIKEYSQFFVTKFLILSILTSLLFPKHEIYIYAITYTILILHYMYNEHSCVI